MTNSTSLRAEAPSFVPGSSSEHAACELSPRLSLSNGVAARAVNNQGEAVSERRRPRRRRRPKKKKPSIPQTNEGECLGEDGSIRQNGTHEIENRRSNRWNNHQESNSDTTNMKVQQRRTRNVQSSLKQRPGPRNDATNRRGRRMRQRRNMTEQEPQPIRLETPIEFNSSSPSPSRPPLQPEELLLKSSFPALNEAVLELTESTTVSTQSAWHPQGNDKNESNTRLLQNLRQHQLAEQRKEAVLRSKIQDENDTSSTLTTLVSMSLRKRQEKAASSSESTDYASLPASSPQTDKFAVLSGEEEHTDTVRDQDRAKSTEKDVCAFKSKKNGRRLNIARLRDSWWKAIAMKRKQEDLLVELKQCLKPYDPLPSETYDLTNEVDDDSHPTARFSDEKIPNISTQSARGVQSTSAQDDGISTKVERQESTNTATNVHEVVGESNEDMHGLWKLVNDRNCVTAERRTAVQTLVAQWNRQMISSSWSEPIGFDAMLDDSLSLAIELDLPTAIETILSICDERDAATADMCTDPKSTPGRRHNQPLLLAASLGRDDMITIILSRYSQTAFSDRKKKSKTITDILSTQRDVQGNNVFHSCCQGPLSTQSTLQLLLDQLSSTSTPSAIVGSKKLKKHQSLSSKLMLATNRRGQTALHCACECGRIDLVETMLQFLSSNETPSSLLPRLLVLRDNAHQTPLLAAVTANATDVVLTLLLWRVNDYAQHEQLQLIQLEEQQQQEYCRKQQQQLKVHHRNILESIQVRPSRLSAASHEDANNLDAHKSVTTAALGDPFGFPPTMIAAASFSCPLVWASKTWNLEMMNLLLEFANDHVTPYHHTDALYACLMASGPASGDIDMDDGDNRDPSNPTLPPSLQLDCVQLLIRAGANPFQETPTNMWATRSSLESLFLAVPDDGTNEVTSAVGLAAAVVGSCSMSPVSSHSPARVLRSVVQSGQRQLRMRQQNRRKDPLLRQQPESFFRAMERKEDEELENSLCQALVQSLLAASQDTSTRNANPSFRETKHLIAANTLYREGARLRDIDMERIRIYLANAATSKDSTRGQSELDITIEALDPSYSTLNKGLKEREETKITSSNQARRLLCRMPWMIRLLEDGLNHETNVRCCEKISIEYDNQLHNSEGENDTTEKVDNDQNVLLIARDGSRFEVSAEIMAQSSQKLDAAIRFASMKKKEDEESWNGDMLEIQVDMEPEHCKLFIQHCYHGSVVVGWSTDNRTLSHSDTVCNEVLTLLLIAEEFLCPTLVQECEMRLLSPVPTGCFCEYCSGVVCRDEHGRSREKNTYYVNVLGVSRLITPATALDVFAVVQQLESSSILSLVDNNNTLRPVFPSLKSSTYSPASSGASSQAKLESAVTGGNATTTKLGPQHTRNCCGYKALSAVKDACICVIMNDFYSVIQSDSYQENMIYNNDNGYNDDHKDEDAAIESSSEHEHQDQSLLLLQMCLEELSMSPFTVAYKKKSEKSVIN